MFLPVLIAFLAASPLLGSTENDSVLRSAKSLDSWLINGNHSARDFDLTGRIIHACNKCRKTFALDDGTNIVRLVDNAHWPKLLFKDGDVVHATGRTVTRGVNADCHTLTFIRHGNPRTPTHETVRDLARARNIPMRLVRTQGLVRDAFRDDIDPEFVSFVLTDDGSTIYISLRCEQTSLALLNKFIGAEVVVTGLIRSDIKSQQHQLDKPSLSGCRRIMGPMLDIADINALHVIIPAPNDPYDVPDVQSLRSLTPGDLSTHGRHKAVGRVLTSARKHGFLLLTADGYVVNVDLAEHPSPHTGEKVIATGLPATDLYRINLVRAIWKPVNEGPAIQGVTNPVLITASELFTDKKGRPAFKVDFHGKPVRTSGIVRSLPAPNNQSNCLILSCDGYTLDVLPDEGSDAFSNLALGDTVEVTGICMMDVDQWRPDMALPNIKGVSIAVHEPADIRILARPSWWTPFRLFILVCIITAVAIVIFIWCITLRTLVIRRSRELLREQTHRLTATLRIEERTRLATELHDTVAQNLSGLSLQLDAAGRLADSDPTTMKSILAFASKALLACRRELRDCLWDLRSQALDERDMNAAIQRALTPHLSNIQLLTRFNVPRRKLADHTAHAVLRILGELANNAVKHGKAKTLRIAGSLDDEGLKFSCVDDGCGFDVKNTPGSAAGHFGLQGIRDRIRAFNGSFQLTSIQGKGTRAVIILHPAPLET